MSPFSDTITKRAKKRVVVPAGDNRWVVRGNSSLGDTRNSYPVEFHASIPPHGKYHCACYDNLYGDVRKAKVCSHVVAVILYRQALRSAAEDHPTPADVDSTVAAQRLPSLSSAAVIPHVSAFRHPSLPPFITSIRPHQWQAVLEIVDLFRAGKRVVWLDAPTGSGKTLIAELVRREMKTEATYVCSSKTLQDQILGDYPYAAVLKGRSNYPTLLQPYPEFDAGDCNAQPGDDESCGWCPNTKLCAYNRAKDAANSSPLAVLNTSYFLSAYNYTQSMRRPELVIADECDVLEQELMGFVEFRLGFSMLRILGATAPKKGVHKKAIVDWLTEQFRVATLMMQAISPRTQDIRDLRKRRALERMCQGMKLIVKEIGEDVWVRDNAAGPLVLKPVTVDRYGETALWRHGDKWLCMSASIISPEVLAQSLGLTNMEDWGLVRVPMTFPVENRRIYVAPVASMSNKEKDTARPIMVTAIRSVMDLHPDERILVHTVSYELAGYLYDQLEDTRRVLTYRSAAERDVVVREFRSTPGSVLLASSLDRGIDLKGDDCRVVVVAKTPFPYLGDPQVSARLHLPGGQAWYSVQTIRSLVQMTGRAVRSKDDWAVTYILDRQFISNVWRKQGHLLPKWWKEAVDMTFPVRQLTQQGKGA